jgi:hypothetical protein
VNIWLDVDSVFGPSGRFRHVFSNSNSV